MNPVKAEKRKYQILLVDDNSCFLEVVYQILREKDYQVTTVTSGEAAIDLIRKRGFDLVITDLNMGGVNGIEVLKKTKELNPETGGILMTANQDAVVYLDALRALCDYLLKPFDVNDFLHMVSHCLRKEKHSRNNYEVNNPH